MYTPKILEHVSQHKESAEESSDEDDDSTRSGNGRDEDAQQPPVPDFEDFGEDAQQEDFDLSFDFNQANDTQDLLEKNPLPPLRNNTLATSTFGPPSTLPLSTFNGSKKKKKKKRKNRNTISPQDDSVRDSSDSQAFSDLQQRKQSIRAENYSARAKKSAPHSRNMSTNTRARELAAQKAPVVSNHNSDASGSDSNNSASKSNTNSESPATSASGSSPNGENVARLTNDEPEQVTRATKIPRKTPASTHKGAPESASKVPASASKVHESTSKTSGSTSTSKKRSPPPGGAISNSNKKSKILTMEEKELQLKAYMVERTAKDKKLSTGERLKQLTMCRQEVYVLTSNINDYQHQIVCLKQTVRGVRLKEKKTYDQLEMLQLQHTTQTTRARSKLLRMSQEQKRQAEDLAKEHLWRLRKFISCPDEEVSAAQYVLDLMNLPEMKTEENKWSWIETYKKTIKKAFFQRRNYVTSEMKKLVNKDFLNKGKPLPHVGMIVRCATRAIDPNNAEELEFFLWYWESLLPKMVGSAQWSKEAKYYTTISKATVTEGKCKGKQLITYTAEAMLCAIWENNETKWPKLHVWSAKPENKGKPQPNWNGTFTIVDGGQNEWGGWKPEGLEAFNNYVAQVKAGRKSKKCAKLEKIALAKLRLRLGIDCANHDEQLRRNRAIKRRLKTNAEIPWIERTIPQARVVRALYQEDDDEEDDDEEDVEVDEGDEEEEEFEEDDRNQREQI